MPLHHHHHNNNNNGSAELKKKLAVAKRGLSTSEAVLGDSGNATNEGAASVCKTEPQ
jgi:hypothetical protein